MSCVSCERLLDIGSRKEKSSDAVWVVAVDKGVCDVNVEGGKVGPGLFSRATEVGVNAGVQDDGAWVTFNVAAEEK